MKYFNEDGLMDLQTTHKYNVTFLGYTSNG